ncbi:MAG: hypothetical protein IPP17_18800 [Bacteroidetes bacterium]|nr:hypothetical protein [Bacteroidota bacterium]
MKRHYWTAICTEERLKAMADLTRIIDQYATILNFQRFSDVSLSLVLELEANKVSELQIALRQVLLLEGEDVAPTNTTKDCLVLMNVTFARGKEIWRWKCRSGKPCTEIATRHCFQGRNSSHFGELSHMRICAER